MNLAWIMFLHKTEEAKNTKANIVKIYLSLEKEVEIKNRVTH